MSPPRPRWWNLHGPLERYVPRNQATAVEIDRRPLSVSIGAVASQALELEARGTLYPGFIVFLGHLDLELPLVREKLVCCPDTHVTGRQAALPLSFSRLKSCTLAICTVGVRLASGSYQLPDLSEAPVNHVVCLVLCRGRPTDPWQAVVYDAALPHSAAARRGRALSARLEPVRGLDAVVSAIAHTLTGDPTLEWRAVRVDTQAPEFRGINMELGGVAYGLCTVVPCLVAGLMGSCGRRGRSGLAVVWEVDRVLARVNAIAEGPDPDAVWRLVDRAYHGELHRLPATYCGQEAPGRLGFPLAVTQALWRRRANVEESGGGTRLWPGARSRPY